MAVCPSCGEENPDKAKFCFECGTPLGAAPASQGEERKIVSVLFVDLVGFTARSHAADPEDVRAALKPYHERLQQESERFGGTVEKFIGDAVMTVFGAPVAHEDDAERAVRAALRIIEAIQEMNESNPPYELAIRGAVNTGEVLVSLSEDMGQGLVGDAVNTASRLQSVAPVNGIVVGEATYRATQDIIDYEPLDPVSVKGKPEPLAIWRVLSARSRLGLESAPSYATPFIGREFDLGTLKHAYHRTLRESSVQLVTVVGEPGVGKSRLLAELAAYIDEQSELVSWRQGRCLSYGDGITFWALNEIVKAHAGILESDPAPEAIDKLAAAVGTVIEYDSERPWFVARLAALVGTEQHQSSGGVTKEESFTAWRRFLEAIASTRPLVLIFEDIHWADAALLEFIEHLVEWTTGVPLMVVCTARPELYEKHSSWAGGMRNATTVSLSPLSDQETAQLVSALLSQAVLPAEIHAALLERAGGNPLYAEEFIRMLSDRGTLQRHGRVISIDPSADIPIPETVQALIAARIDTLTLPRKALLHDAAVAGKVFWSGALAAMGGVTEEEVIKGLHELARKEIVRPSRSSSLAGQKEYSFWHGLIKDVSYGQIPRTGRITKHRAMASWIQAMAGDSVTDHAEVLAHHYGEALELARAAGVLAVAKELMEPAQRFLTAAGDRAMQLDMAAADHYYTKAVALVSPGDPERAELLIKAALVADNRGRPDHAVAWLEEAIEEARSQGDRRGEGHAMARLGSVMWIRGDTERSTALATKAVELLEQEPPGAELVYAYHRLADVAEFSGDAQGALERAERALTGAERIGDDIEMVGALASRGAARCSLGDLGGLQDMNRALQEGLRLGLGSATSYVYSELCDWTWRNEGAEAGEKMYAEAAEFEDQRGMTASASFTRAESLMPLFDLGRWDELNALADALLDESYTSAYVEAIALSGKVHVTISRGRLSESASLVESLLPLARSIKDLQVLVPALAAASLLHWRRGDANTAMALISELEELTQRSMWRARYLPAVARVLVSAGEVGRAEVLLRDVPAAAARDRQSVVSAEAMVAEAHEDIERAMGLYEDVATRWARFGHVLEHGHALLGVGRCLSVLGQRGKASMRFQEARDIFVRLGAEPLVEETETFVGASGARGDANPAGSY